MTRATLKSYFVRGAIPTAAQFAALIDFFFSKEADTLGIADITGLSAALGSKASAAVANDAYTMAQEAIEAVTRHTTVFYNQQIFDITPDTLAALTRPAVFKFWVVNEDDPGYGADIPASWTWKPLDVYPTFTTDAELAVLSYHIDLGYAPVAGMWQAF